MCLKHNWYRRTSSIHASRDDASIRGLHTDSEGSEAGQLGMTAPMTMSDTGMLAPMTLTPTGVAAQAGGGNADYWYWNNAGYLLRHRTLHRRSLFVPRDKRPVQLQERANSWKTIAQYIDKPNQQYIEDAWQRLNHRQQKRLPGSIRKGKTWFKVKPGARERYNEQVLKAQQ